MHLLAENAHRTESANRLTVSRVQCRAFADDNNSTSTQTATPTPNVAVLDKLVSVFASKPPIEWRKLIAHSKQWPQLSGSVLARCNTVEHDTVYNACSHATSSNHVAVNIRTRVACEETACACECSTLRDPHCHARGDIHNVMPELWSMQDCRAKRGRGRHREEVSIEKTSSAP